MSDKKMRKLNAVDWYKDAIIYELHIKAFCDSNDDGIGDFNGLISKLDYLQSLGITAIWLLPFYPSPLRDDGYDIADYYSINPAYGNLRQFENFLAEAHKRGLKVITELVINHTSDKHPWFQRARKSPPGSPEREFYVWTDNPHQYREVRIIFQDFEASNWTWDPVARQYFWHRFFHHQPDLNYDNPLVIEEIFNILDFWCSMGVDGFRLDAIPYLFEREGTNCENLPETHAFLKRLRKHVDEKFPGTLLLAEANMWPEDSAAYFGNGDECHMNYHFPLMPRMFMALEMEDKHPITEIFDQTPEIPASCQWALFLRNHDELTLEMVTDEERDYMYKVYTKDAKARINLGIRHRLAPLLGNNRKKIELLHSLLFSLPGTPVLYYGDEIGMGDNFYLGDRDGVRTPMQWSADRNAGFSECDPYKLYLPLISDPVYHYESVNVTTQSKDPASLMWWVRRMVQLRRKHPAFSRGSFTILGTSNSKVLAFVRSHEDETILVLVNLSRYLQPVELELPDFAGYRPVELTGNVKFPAIKSADPYLFMVGPYDCQWFLLENTEQETEVKSVPIPSVKTWSHIVGRECRDLLENTLLPEYLQKVRWFGGKSRAMRTVNVIRATDIPVGNSTVYLLLIEVGYESGLPELYQLPLAFAAESGVSGLRDNFPRAIISGIKLDGQEGVLFDALYWKEFQQEIIKLMALHDTIQKEDSVIEFTGVSKLAGYIQQGDLKSRILPAEQSNTSIVYGNDYFLKIYRKVDHSINPDLELTRFLTEEAGFKYIPSFCGAMQWKSASGTIVLAMLQEQVQNNGDAWTYILDRLDTYYDKVMARNVPAPLPMSGSLVDPVVFEQMPLAMKEMLDITLAGQITLLGKRTAEMHLALASNTDLPEFKPEEFSLHYQRSLYAGYRSSVPEALNNLQQNLHKLPAVAKQEAEQVLSIRQQLMDSFRRIYEKKLSALKIRIHGDYHLGQVLFTGKDFVLLDFEGEPARTYSERRLKRSPLRDVAGMIRSFHYAAFGSLQLSHKFSEAEKEQLFPFAEQWFHYSCGFFMNGYLTEMKNNPLIPEDKNDLLLMLETYIIEKAIYELNYELNNRPDWSSIPLKGILFIMNNNQV